MYQTNQQIIHINLDDILPNRFQPRLKFNEEEIANLAESIKEHGVIQPIVVRKLGDRYELIAGERRTKASIMAGKTTIPAIVVDLNDSESAEVALIENVQRQDLTAIEEAVSYRKILDMGYLNQSQLADKVGKKQSTIANKLRLLTLPKKVQDALLDSKISERHARSLLRLDNAEKQNKMLDRIIEERLTVRKTDQEIDKMINTSKIEVLDINSLPRNGEEEMYNNDMNGMDFSTNNVVSDITPQANQNSSFNPGFMDIERIQNQAQDININNQVSSPPEQIIPTIPTPEKKVDEIPTPKFFNLLDSEPLVSTNSEQTKIVEPEKVVEINDQNTAFNIFDVPTTQINLEPQNTLNTFDNSVEQLENIKEPVTQLSQETSINNDNNSIQSLTSTQSIVTQNIEEPTSNLQPVLTSELQEEISIIDENDFNQGESTSLPISEPTQIKLPLKDAISKVRECSSVLNQMGYIVETDEIDLEDKYQVIFNIEK